MPDRMACRIESRSQWREWTLGGFGNKGRGYWETLRFMRNSAGDEVWPCIVRKATAQSVTPLQIWPSLLALSRSGLSQSAQCHHSRLRRYSSTFRESTRSLFTIRTVIPERLSVSQIDVTQFHRFVQLDLEKVSYTEKHCHMKPVTPITKHRLSSASPHDQDPPLSS